MVHDPRDRGGGNRGRLASFLSSSFPAPVLGAALPLFTSILGEVFLETATLVRLHTYCSRSLKTGRPAFMFIDSHDRLWVEKGKGEAGPVAKVIECAKGRYEVKDVEFGRVYKWRPKRIVG